MAPANDNRPEDGIVDEVLLGNPEFLRRIVERALQQILEREMTAHIGAEWDDRGEGRTGHSNGCKPRRLRTSRGLPTHLFAMVQRNEKALVLTRKDMYVEEYWPGR